MPRPLRIISLALPVCLYLLFSDGNGVHAAGDRHCPPLGPVLPVPTAPNSHPAVSSAVAILQKGFDEMTAQFNLSAVSIGAISAHEITPMLELHHTPSLLDNRGVSKVDSNTVYRIGSASKLFAVLATLKVEGVDLNDPITKYLPELRDMKNSAPAQSPVYVVDWDNITLGALASHMAGIPADLMIDLANFPGPWTELGLPPVNASERMTCATFSGDQPVNCTMRDFLDNFGKRPPIQAPFTTPAYSNIGTPLLAFVIERVTNKTYASFVQDTILGPLDMSRTTLSAPDDAARFIPVNYTFPDNIGFEGPAGAYYSTLTDMLTFGSAILSFRTLSPARTRAWMKPVSATSSRGMQMGAPWEIYQATNVTADNRLVELYTKSGDLSAYHAHLALIPDYGLTLAILSAGPDISPTTLPALTAAAVRALLPALEAAGKTQAQAAYAGVYADPASNSTLTLALDADGPGLRIDAWTVRGVDVPASYGRLVPGGGHPGGAPARVRLYLTELGGGGEGAWRAGFEAPGGAEGEGEGVGVPWLDGGCVAWAAADRVAYGFRGVDLVVFEVVEGRATAVGVPAYGVVMGRL